MNKWQIYLLFFTVVACILGFMYYIAPHQIDWRINYSSKFKQPSGTYVLVEDLKHQFGVGRVQQTQQATIPLLDSLQRQPTSAYVLMDRSIELSDSAQQALLRYVAAGNHAVLAFEDFLFGPIADTIGIKTISASWNWFTIDAQDTSSVSLVMEGPLPQRTFYTSLLSVGWVFEPYQFLKPFDTLGVNKEGAPNLVRVAYGKGYFYLSSAPALFSNYHMVHPGGNYYSAALFSLIPTVPLYFDEYYHTGIMQSPNEFRAVLDNPALRAGWLTMGALLLLFAFFGGKRLSRPMPVVKPPSNSSLDFVRAIGFLYLQQGDHDDLARKKVLYFTDLLRNKYRVNFELKDQALVQEVALKCGVPVALASDTLGLVMELSKMNSIGEARLLNFSKQLEKFHQRASNV